MVVAKDQTVGSLLDDPALDGMSDTEKRQIVEGRLFGLRSTLAGVLLDRETAALSVDIPEEARKANRDRAVLQERTLRDTIAKLREIHATLPDPDTKA